MIIAAIVTLLKRAVDGPYNKLVKTVIPEHAHKSILATNMRSTSLETVMQKKYKADIGVSDSKSLDAQVQEHAPANKQPSHAPIHPKPVDSIAASVDETCK